MMPKPTRNPKVNIFFSPFYLMVIVFLLRSLLYVISYYLNECAYKSSCEHARSKSDCKHECFLLSDVVFYSNFFVHIEYLDNYHSYSCDYCRTS